MPWASFADWCSAELGIAEVMGAFELVLMGSAAASLSAWWALGFLLRAFEQGGRAPSPKILREREQVDER